jgi:hypothetical protein
VKPKLKPPATKHLKLKCDVLLSISAFDFNLRRYDKAEAETQLVDVRQVSILAPIPCPILVVAANTSTREMLTGGDRHVTPPLLTSTLHTFCGISWVASACQSV